MPAERVHFAGPRAVQDMVAAHKRGQAVGITSVCSANRFVLEAAMRHTAPDAPAPQAYPCGIRGYSLREAARDGETLLVEATCNQVNQYGGYTGMTPDDFAAFLANIAAELGFPTEKIILGGDHLGPNPWQKLAADEAMRRAREMVSAYVRAGFCKIHLDASMRLGSDPQDRPLDPVVSARRAAELCAVAEASAPAGPPVYVIGTEVPVPGGAQQREEEEILAVTTPQAAGAVLQLFQETFNASGLGAAWQRVVALVVQPGVEFGDERLYEYHPGRAAPLSRWIETIPGLVFEAHSTDYQSARALKELVRDHFAILKVGPGLTFAFREAVFALARMEQEWPGSRPGAQPSRLVETVEAAMRADPRYWAPYYHGGRREQAFARKYSFSDRIRYYWPRPEVAAALERLLGNLESSPPPLPLVSQYLPAQYQRLREGKIRNTPRELIRDHIQDTLRQYRDACKG